MCDRNAGGENWGMWGSTLADRQSGTVREDHSADGDAWNSSSFDAYVLRIYRWGEDGLLGICDDDCLLCFAPAFWNGHDQILKERLFGLSNPQRNHGEDLKEEYSLIDDTPAGSYMRGLYRSPQAEFPYRKLIEENAHLSRTEPEFKLVVTGIFDKNRFFDIAYAQAAQQDLCIRISVINRGPDAVGGLVWMSMNFIEALQIFGFYFGDEFRVRLLTGRGNELSLWEISLELEKRLVSLLLEGPDGRRPFRGPGAAKSEDWRELVAFHEYFHGDNGKGLGASHQTGWTALVAKMIRQLHRYGS